MTLEEIKKIKKAELHVHLDGSMRLQTIKELAQEQGLELTEEDLKKCIVPEDCKDLNQYLEAFEIPVKVLQTKEALTRAAKELAEDLKADGVVLAEIRFAPGKHTEKGLTQDEVVAAVLEGLRQVDGIHTELILCCMRGPKEDKKNEEINLETVDVAKRFLENGVCAIDLAGAEKQFPVEDHKNLFEKAKQYGVPYTIHAGEAAGVESIEKAIRLGAKRIGHGTAAIQSEELMRKLAEEGIPLECCPTSNSQTKSIERYENHPINVFLQKGINATLNTDNRTVSGIKLSEEFKKAQDQFGLTDEQLVILIKNSIDASFYNQRLQLQNRNNYKKEEETR